jgi:hypothetical protein
MIPEAEFMNGQSVLLIRDRGSSAFLTAGIGMGKKSGSGSGMNNQDHISWSLENIFWVKIFKFFDVDPGSGIQDENFGFGMEKVGSGINIPDPQHCVQFR